MAVITNAGVTVYTMQFLDANAYSLKAKFWIFILFQWVCFTIQVRFRASISLGDDESLTM